LIQDETGSINITVWGLASLHAKFTVGDGVEIVGALKPKKTNVHLQRNHLSYTQTSLV
jgi:hypothetical protein